MKEQDLSKTACECAAPVETVILQTATVAEALADLRKRKIKQKIIYFYAVDEEQKLKGVVSTRQLILADPHMKVEEVMQKSVVRIKAYQTLKDALEAFAAHPLLALPVVDEENHLLGAIDLQMISEEALDVADERSRSDAFQMVGLTLEERRKIPLFHSFRIRMPWLLCNVFSGLVCAVISRYYEEVLSAFLLLAFFIPLVLTLSESASMQSVAQSLQFLRRPRFHWRSALRRSLREWQVALLLSLTLGLLVGAISMFWGQGILPSTAVGVGIVSGVAFSSIFGILTPIFLHRLKLDPRVASGPLVLMIADILTTAFYLAIATWWLL